MAKIVSGWEGRYQITSNSRNTTAGGSSSNDVRLEIAKDELLVTTIVAMFPLLPQKTYPFYTC